MKRAGGDIARNKDIRRYRRDSKTNSPKNSAQTRGNDPANLLVLEAPPLAVNPDLAPGHDFSKCYKVVNKIMEGSYGVVIKAIDLSNNQVVALKRFKDHPGSSDSNGDSEGFTVNGIREIAALKNLQHKNIINLQKVTVSDDHDGNYNYNIYLVLDYVENDLRTILRNMRTPFTESECKTLLWQVLSALEYMHDKWYMHRDLSPSNILLDNRGRIKVADFGLCKRFGGGSESGLMLTRVVVTRYYRAPEILLLDYTDPEDAYVDSTSYGCGIDLWSLGCIFAELIGQKVLFKGDTDADQLLLIMHTFGVGEIHEALGLDHLHGRSTKHGILILTKNSLREETIVKNFAESLPRLTSSGPDLLARMLRLDPCQRATASQCLQDVYFQERPLPKNPDLLPSFPVYTH